ncbi:MAG: DHA2 family efflux MFS transporter permease subunit, partial [Polymorphobacter sp.]
MASAPTAAAEPPLGGDVSDPNALAITFVVMLGSFMQVLDSTIANVALPHMQASLGAAADTITWVLTSYIAATAVATPMTGWLADKFGRRRLFIAAISGFVVTSMLCGAAQSLNQMVVFRILQGVSGAFLIPLGQSYMLDAYPQSRHAKAMAWFGVGIMVGPIMGPLLGGWLTDNFDWRWVFYVNLPVGLLTLAGALVFLRDTPRTQRRFDLFGFVALSIAVLAFQLMLDRGQQLDWFDAWEVRIEAGVALAALWVFGVHTVSTGNGILNMELLRDRNCATGFTFIFIVGLMMVATTALLPPMLQGLLGYPVLTSGMVLAPRGVGTMVGMMLMGQIVGKVDPRLLLLCGLALTGVSMHMMSQFSPQMDMQPVV